MIRKTVAIGVMVAASQVWAQEVPMSVEQRLHNLEALVKNLSQEVNSLRQGNPEKVRHEYPVNDQHDTLMVTLQDNVTDAATNQIEKAARLVHWEQLQDAYSHGSISEASMKAMRLQIGLDALNESSLAHRIAATRAKVRSLEGLQNGLPLEFARGDKETNFELFEAFGAELQKAHLVAAHAADRYQNLHALYLAGASPWAHDHEAEVEMKKTAEAVSGWKRKVGEQEKQYLAAAEDLKKVEKTHP